MTIPQNIRAHHYTDIAARNRGISRYKSDLHIWKEEDIWGNLDWTYHLGEEFLLGINYHGQFGRSRFHWNPNSNLSKDEIVKNLVTHYSKGVSEQIKGNPLITAELQLEYKARGKDVKFRPAESARGLELIHSHSDYSNFKGFILWGFDPPGYFTCAGLDTLEEKPWDTSHGLVFVETDMPLGNWFADLFSSTSKPHPVLEKSGLINLLESRKISSPQ